MGLRELKKDRMRKSISNLATRLFIEKGYHNVTMAEIAEKAQVSVPTLFNYFPSKEALVFDEDKEQENELIDAVVSRKQGTSILDALRDFTIQHATLEPEELKNFKTFNHLIDSTPELSNYAKSMWMRHEQSLASIIQKEAKKKISKIEAEAIAHFCLDSLHRSLKFANPKANIDSLFSLLKNGWNG